MQVGDQVFIRWRDGIKEYSRENWIRVIVHRITKTRIHVQEVRSEMIRCFQRQKYRDDQSHYAYYEFIQGGGTYWNVVLCNGNKEPYIISKQQKVVTSDEIDSGGIELVSN